MLHTDKHYEAELGALGSEMSRMGELVKRMLDQGRRALATGQVAEAKAVADLDYEVDSLELKIDEMALRLLARRQPVASDLRFITATFKMVTDLERIGDLASHFAERLIELEGGPIPCADSLLVMSDHASAMVTDAMQAYAERDEARAQAVLELDNTVDEAYAQLFPRLVSFMLSEPAHFAAAQRVQSIAKYLERVADHATNLAEMVTFMVNGRDLRHGRIGIPQRSGTT
ncbi:MAG: PhoU family transcriptional regulator [Pseudomonadota bacterium]|jgi:phosphate transport system protein